MRNLLLIIVLAFGLRAGVFAGEFDDGLAAYVRGDYATAFARFKGLAAQQDADAQYWLGVMYEKGQGVAQDYKQAVFWYEKAAAQGNVVAQWSLGAMYDNGEGVEQDYKQALFWYEKAAAQGEAAAQNNLGVMYEKGQGVAPDYKQAVFWYGKAAAQGNAKAQHSLGTMYAHGRGVVQNYKQAVFWYERAATQADAAAQNNLGTMYLFGRGVTRDYKRAVFWYEKAAAQGDAAAQYNLGVMYHKGEGVAQDYVEAHKWWNLAGANGDADARKGRQLVEKIMTPQQIAEAQRLAREWSPQRPDAQRTPSERQGFRPIAPAQPGLAGSGTGFYVSNDGHVLTNSHVVHDCVSVGVEAIGKPPIPANVLASDARNDLAVVQTKERTSPFARFRSDGVRQGESVVVYGFPLSGTISSTGNATTGNVTALSGLRDDTRMLQISAPVQPGNSGGPLMDMSGAVVGIVVGKLNAAKVMEVIGDIPQNINFAIKSNVAKGFLESYGIEHETIPKTKDSSVPDVAELARTFSVRVLCYR